MRCPPYGLILAFGLVGLLACSRQRKTAAAGSLDAGADAAELATSSSGLLYSRPIAASVVPRLGVVVAGLVAPKATIAVESLSPDGKAQWTATAFTDVAWSSSAELHVLPSSEGALVLWRGLRSGKTVTQAVLVGDKGQVHGAPFDIGAAACATDDAVAWVERGPAGTGRVRWLSGAGPAVDSLTIPAERDPVLVCAAKRAFLLGEGEDDVSVTVTGADAGGPLMAMRDRDFGASEEEDEHDEYTVGDTLGIVRFARSGAVAFRELDGAGMTPWRRSPLMVGVDDDVVAVDADAKAAVVVFTRDASDRCAGASAVSVEALRLSRGDVGADAGDGLLEIAPFDCGSERGPFWTGVLPASIVVAWVERAHADRATGAPIAGLAYGVMTGGSAAEPQRIRRPSDELVSAGCDHDRCYAAALTRPAGGDGMEPEPVELLAYP